MIGTICREYRIDKGVSLAELASDNANYQTLYSFEQNRSTNYNHIRNYIRLAEHFGETDILLIQLLKELKNND